MPKEGEALERWTLVTGKEHPPAMDGYKVQSNAGYSKRFVRAVAPKLPKTVEIEPLTAVLSALRKAADGEKVAVLLDGAQSKAMKDLPFAGPLAVLGTSAPMPVAVGGSVSKRLDEDGWKEPQAPFLPPAQDHA